MEQNWILKEAKKPRKSSNLEKNGADFYQITLHAGHGAGWGYGEEYVDEEIKKIIDVNIRMYDFAIDSIITPQDLGEFLTIAYEAYEAF